MGLYYAYLTTFFFRFPSETPDYTVSTCESVVETTRVVTKTQHNAV